MPAFRLAGTASHFSPQNRFSRLTNTIALLRPISDRFSRLRPQRGKRFSFNWLIYAMVDFWEFLLKPVVFKLYSLTLRYSAGVRPIGLRRLPSVLIRSQHRGSMRTTEVMPLARLMNPP